MKFFISFDYEGVSSSVSWKGMDGGRTNEEYLRSALADINAVIDAVAERFPRYTEILVCDSHSFGENLPFEFSRPRVALIRGFPRRYYMMHGLDKTYSGVFLIGYHAPAGEGYSLMDHTYSSSAIFEAKVNGHICGESEINALLAGYYGVPVLLITGDDGLKKHSARTFSEFGTEVLSLKKGISRFAGKLAEPAAVRSAVFRAAKKSLGCLDKVKPFMMKKPFILELTLLDTLRADMCESIPGFRRTGGRTIMFKAVDALELYDALMSCVYVCMAARNILERK